MSISQDTRLVLDLPIRMKASKGTRGKLYALNLNIYRNMHFKVLGDLKIRFSEWVTEELKKNPAYTKLMFKHPKVIYRFYNGSNRITDMMNWVSVVDKFIMDALVKNYVIPNDDITVIDDVHVLYGGLDKGHERVTIELIEEVL